MYWDVSFSPGSTHPGKENSPCLPIQVPGMTLLFVSHGSAGSVGFREQTWQAMDAAQAWMRAYSLINEFIMECSFVKKLFWVVHKWSLLKPRD
jgi:hypothetical protein